MTTVHFLFSKLCQNCVLFYIVLTKVRKRYPFHQILQVFWTPDKPAEKNHSLTTLSCTVFSISANAQKTESASEALQRPILNKKGGQKTAFVLPQGLEPWTPTLRVSCSTN